MSGSPKVRETVEQDLIMYRQKVFYKVQQNTCKIKRIAPMRGQLFAYISSAEINMGN
jgi:hypothetical protein